MGTPSHLRLRLRWVLLFLRTQLVRRLWVGRCVLLLMRLLVCFGLAYLSR